MILANGCKITKSEKCKGVWILSVPTVHYTSFTFWMELNLVWKNFSYSIKILYIFAFLQSTQNKWCSLLCSCCFVSFCFWTQCLIQDGGRWEMIVLYFHLQFQEKQRHIIHHRTTLFVHLAPNLWVILYTFHFDKYSKRETNSTVPGHVIWCVWGLLEYSWIALHVWQYLTLNITENRIIQK